jgi:hypothetical protein
MINELKLNRAHITFTPEQNKHFTVTIEGWNRVGFREMDFNTPVEVWGWNVYAHIYESHPLFNDIDEALQLPFHGGCTYDKIITTAPSQGIKYDFEKVTHCLKVGSDYSHLGDEYHDHQSAFDGIPLEMSRDADELIRALQSYVEDNNSVPAKSSDASE